MKNKIVNRIYNDYFMSSRMDEYEKLLKTFLDNGYEFLMIRDYKKNINKNKKVIFIRHDIDSDVQIAREMFLIEKKLNIKTTYYFRLETFTQDLVSEILSYGSEVGYHYEELATFVKENKIYKKEDVLNSMTKIQDMLISNIKMLEEHYNFKITSIASHGDFMNRKLGITNTVIYDNSLRKKLKLIEAYDLDDCVDFRTSDTMYPKFFKEDPYLAISKKAKKVLLLIHTRYYKRNPKERFKLDVKRFIDSIKYYKINK